MVESNPIADLYMDVLSMTTFKTGYKTSFFNIQREKKSQQILLKLFFGKTDVVCVYQNYYMLAAELNPQLAENLQIIDKLVNIPQGAGFFHVNTPADFRERVNTKVMQLTTHARGRQLLELFKADKVARASLTDFNNVKQLYADYQLLKKSR